MNKQRRKDLSKINDRVTRLKEILSAALDGIESIMADLDDCISEESDAQENCINPEKADEMADNVSNMQEAYDLLDTLKTSISELEDVESKIDEAMGA